MGKQSMGATARDGLASRAPSMGSNVRQVEGKEMNEYFAVMIARAEYENRLRSMTPVYDFDEWIPDEQPGWTARQVGRLLCSLGNGLAAVGDRLRNGRGIVLETQLMEQERSMQ